LIARVSHGRAAWLLVRLRLVRLLNQTGSAFGRWKKAEPGAPRRRATPGKARLGWLVGSLVGLSMLWAFTALAHQAVSNMKRELGSVPTLATSSHAADSASWPRGRDPTRRAEQYREAERTPLPVAPGRFLSPGVLRGATLEVCLLLLAALLVALGSRELAQPDWDLEWLVTLPMNFPTLLGVRVVERTIVNPAGLLALWPFLSLLAWEGGFRFLAPMLGLAFTIVLLVITALLRTLVDTGLRLTLPPPKLRNLQAVVSIGSVLTLYLAMSVGMQGGSFVLDWSKSLPAWAMWLPPGLAVRALTSTGLETAVPEAALLVLEVIVLGVMIFAILTRQLRHGVVASGGREMGGRAIVTRAGGPVGAGPGRRMFLSAVQAREFRLLGRDANFLVQTLVLPVVIVGAQILFSARGDVFASIGQHPEHVAAIAFGVAAYALVFSAFQTLNAEGHALWILYCVPHSLESILCEKALLWGALSLLYPVVIGVGVAINGSMSIEFMVPSAIVLIGVPVYAVIATSLGVFACDPLAQDIQRRVRLGYTYLYMLLSSLFVYAIYATSFWQRVVFMVLTTLLALALWQKARDHLPYLLDPASSPPARVSLSDGLIAAMMFFVFQGVATLILRRIGQPSTGSIILIAFSIAGALTFILMRLAYWRTRATGVPRLLGPPLVRALRWGIGGGIAASIAGIAYLSLVLHFGLFVEPLRANLLVGRSVPSWLVALAVVAAPIFEEFIFRGLVFGGLRRSLGLWPAILASSAIFAIVHPAIAAVPVFGLGVCAALVYERTGFLLAPMLVHAVYNAAILGFQWTN
jgi:ABC-2 type transport system permease protein